MDVLLGTKLQGLFSAPTIPAVKLYGLLLSRWVYFLESLSNDVSTAALLFYVIEFYSLYLLRAVLFLVSVPITSHSTAYCIPQYRLKCSDCFDTFSALFWYRICPDIRKYLPSSMQFHRLCALTPLGRLSSWHFCYLFIRSTNCSSLQSYPLELPSNLSVWLSLLQQPSAFRAPIFGHVILRHARAVFHFKLCMFSSLVFLTEWA
jgi:hypothetical protein